MASDETFHRLLRLKRHSQPLCEQSEANEAIRQIIGVPAEPKREVTGIVPARRVVDQPESISGKKYTLLNPLDHAVRKELELFHEESDPVLKLYVSVDDPMILGVEEKIFSVVSGAQARGARAYSECIITEELEGFIKKQGFSFTVGFFTGMTPKFWKLAFVNGHGNLCVGDSRSLGAVMEEKWEEASVENLVDAIICNLL